LQGQPCELEGEAQVNR